MANRLALELVADANPLTKAMLSAQRSIDKFTDSAEQAGHAVGGSLGRALDNFINISKGGAAAAGVLAGGLAAAATGAVAVTLAAGKQAEALDHLSQKTGISTRTLQSWSVIMAQNNFQAESLTSGMRTLSKQIVEAQDPSSKAAAAFEEMGLSIEDLGSTESTIRAVSDRFKDMVDGPEKARMAIQLFGKAGLEMIPILNKGAKAFDESRRDAERFGLVLSTTQMDALTAADDAVDRLGASFDGLKTRIALVFAGSVTSGINALTEGMVKLTTITANYSKALDEVKKDHAILSSLFPAGAAAMAAVKAAQMPSPTPPPEIPQGPDQNAHVVAQLALGQEQEKLGRKIRDQLIYKYKLLESEKRAQEALGKTVNDIAMREFGERNKAFGMMVDEAERVRVLNLELSKPPTTGPFVDAIEQKEAAVRNLLNLMPELTREEAIALAARNDAAGTRIVQDSTEAWKHRNDTLEMAVSYAKTLDEAQQVAFETERSLFKDSTDAIQARMNLIKAEGDLKRKLIEEEIISEDEKAGKLLQLEIELDTKRRQVAQAFPSFWEKQMQAIEQSNSFSVALIANTWTSGIANAIVNGGDFAQQALKSTQVALLQAALNFGIQKLAVLTMQAAQELAIWVTLQSSKLATQTATDAAIVGGTAATAGATVGIWEGAAAAITGTFAAITGAITGFFTATLIPFFVAIGEALMTFLASIAAAASTTIFGIPYGVAILAGVALIAAAIGTLAAFAFADGGIVTGPTMGMIGEAGSNEAVIPLNKRGAAFMRDAVGGGTGGGPVTIQVDLDGRTIARSVFDNMPSIMRVRGIAA